MATDFSRVVLEPDERVIKAVGQGYFASLLDGSLAKTYILLTNKRVYFRGVNFVFPLGARHEEVAVPLRAITGIKYSIQELWLRKIIGSIILTLAIIALILVITLTGYFGQSQRILMMSLPINIIIFTLVFLLEAILKKVKLFTIEYPSGSIRTLSKFFSEGELKDFQHCLFVERYLSGQGKTVPTPVPGFNGSLVDRSESTVRAFINSSREEPLFVLGEGYLTSMLKGSLSKNVMLVTDKRVYASGTTYTHGVRIKERQIVHLDDIRGVCFINYRPVNYLIAAILCTIFTFPVYPLFIFAVVFYIIYFMRKDRLLQISYPGGAISLSVKMYTDKELSDAIKNLSLLSSLVRPDRR